MAKEIFLTQGKVSLVDDEDYEMLKVLGKRWCLNDGYAYSSVHGRMHRFLLGASDKTMVDHINGDKLDNRRANLRLCNNSQNQANRRAICGVSPFKGVTWQRRPDGTGTWKAQLVVDGKTLYLGAYKTDLQAAIAYNESAQKHFGEFAYLNDLTLPASPQESVYAIRRQVKRDNPYGLKGVTFDKGRDQWVAQLSCKGVTHLKKRYPTAEAAARAYDEVAKKVYGPQAVCNYRKEIDHGC